MVHDRSLGRSFSPIRGLKSNWSIIVTPVTRNPIHRPQNRNSHFESNRYFFKTHPTALSSQCSLQDLTQQEHLHTFAQIFATFPTRSFLAGMFDGQCNIIYDIYYIFLLRRHVRWARAYSQAVALLPHHLP